MLREPETGFDSESLLCLGSREDRLHEELGMRVNCDDLSLQGRVLLEPLYTTNRLKEWHLQRVDVVTLCGSRLLYGFCSIRLVAAVTH